jgi:hypothetical protein
MPALLAGMMLLYAAVTTIVVLTLPQGSEANVVVTDVATVLAATTAAVLASIAAYRSSGRMRASWEFIAAGLATWAAAEVIWTTYEIILHREVPLPSAADVGYLGAVPLLLAGIVLLGSASRLLARVRTVLDGVALVLAICVLVWHQVLLPIYSDSGSDGHGEGDRRSLSAYRPVAVLRAGGGAESKSRGPRRGSGVDVLGGTGGNAVGRHRLWLSEPVR